jgi:hypothetical protein
MGSLSWRLCDELMAVVHRRLCDGIEDWEGNMSGTLINIIIQLIAGSVVQRRTSAQVRQAIRLLAPSVGSVAVHS